MVVQSHFSLFLIGPFKLFAVHSQWMLLLIVFHKYPAEVIEVFCVKVLCCNSVF